MKENFTNFKLFNLISLLSEIRCTAVPIIMCVNPKTTEPLPFISKQRYLEDCLSDILETKRFGNNLH